MARLVGLICLLTCVAWPAVAADDPGGLPKLNPLTGQPYSEAARADYERQLRDQAAQDEIAQQVTEQYEAEHAAAIEANKPIAQAFEQKLQAYADSRGVSGGTSKNIHTTYTADGLPESGEVYWRNNAGDVVYRAEFDTDGNLISEGQTADGRAWEAIAAAKQAGGKKIDFHFEEVPGGGYHISGANIRDADGNVRAVLEFNEQGEVWRGSYYDENGNLIRKVDRPDLAPKPDTMGGPLPVPGQVRPITGVCDKCQPLADARNDLAGEIDAVVRRLQDVSEQHTTAFRNQQYWLKKAYAQLMEQYDTLKPQFDAAHARLMACLKTCNQPAPAQPDTSNIVDSGGCTAATVGACTEPPDACDVSLGPCDAEPAPDPQLGTNPPATPTSFDATGIQPTAELYPSDDSDLDAIIATANDYAARGGQCTAMECPKGDCARIQQVAQLLLDLETYLEAMNEWARLAHDAASQAFENQVANSTLAADQLARTQLANAVHQTLHNFASSLFNIASLMDFARGIATGETSLDEMSLPELMERLDDIYGAMKDMEGQLSTLGDIEGDPNVSTPITDLVGNGSGQFNNQMINNTVDTISDVKSALTAAVESGKDWRKWVKKGGLAAVGSIAGTWLTTISEAQLNERLKVANDLADNIIPAQQKVQGSAYDRMRRAANRHWSVQDALTAVRAARSAWSACAMKACGAASLTKPTLPDFVDVSPDGKTTIKSYGRALRYYNALVAAINTALKPPPEIHNDCPATPSTTTGVVQSGTPTALVMGDSSTYCQYLPASPVPTPLSPLPPGGAPSGGTPGIPPPPGTPSPGQPGDTTDTNNPPEGTPPAPQTTAPPPDQPEEEPPPSLPPNVIVKAKASVLSSAPAGEPVAGFEVKLMPTDDVALPGDGVARDDAGFADPPAQCTTGADGSCTLAAGADDLSVCSADGNCEPIQDCPECRWELAVDATDQTSLNVETGPDFDTASLGELEQYVVDTLTIGATQYVTLTFPVSQQTHVTNVLGNTPGVLQWDANLCGDKQPGPNDPLYLAHGTWGQDYSDQWGLEHIGFTTDADSAWSLIDANAAGVVVAVIDSGLDWNHADIDWDRLWRNPAEIPDNGVDDDRNGYVDDVIGWNFVDRNNKPWDHDGHGTFVTGIIAATADNGIGIAGSSPVARIMVLKALNAFGHTRASYLAKALVYAADNGARVVNLSVGHRKLARIETAAIDYAWRKGVVMVVAAGNEGTDVADYGIASLDHVITVGAVGPSDRRPVFSNWGAQVDLAAPGVDILSLRARRTDTMLGIPEVNYVPGSAFVGADARYYRASGTSFAAPFVAAVASLVIAQHPKLTPDAVRRVLVESARDVDVPGVDQYTGYGIVDARAALSADPNFFLDASITRVQVAVVDGKQVLQVFGSVNSDALRSAHVELGAGKAPSKWRKVGAAIDTPQQDALLVNVPVGLLRDSKQWTLRVVAKHTNGRTREAHFLLNLN